MRTLIGPCMYVDYVCMYVHHIEQSTGEVANPARGQLSAGRMNISLSPFAPENLVSRDGFDRPVPRQPAFLYTQVGYEAY